jgi:hypothetical protein
LAEVPVMIAAFLHFETGLSVAWGSIALIHI